MYFVNDLPSGKYCNWNRENGDLDIRQNVTIRDHPMLHYYHF